MSLLTRRLFTGVLLIALPAVLWFLPAAPAHAQPKGKTESKSKRTKTDLESAAPQSGPADYASKNFLMHTDLPPKEANDLLKRMETMLTLISKYWGRPSVGVIECYVVKDLKVWPAGAIDERGLQSIEEQAGVTLGVTRSQGNSFTSKATVYAVADRGTPLHEAVHAYCIHAFGRTGPVWYAEGMAEMGQYWREGEISVNAHDVVIQYLQQSEPKELLAIVDNTDRTGDSWQNYAWRWALCHLLCNNPNYAARFRPLGLGLLGNAPVSFEVVYGDMAKEISFEYAQFLEHIENGYRVDLCSWDWKAKFKRSRSGGLTTSTIDAGHGWQPSRLSVVGDEEYEYSAAGTWTLAKDSDPVGADGQSDGGGRLEGVILKDYELGKPFDLGAYGSFVAPSDGDLYLRCKDNWVGLVDNKGKMSVKLKVKGKGNPLPAPKATDKPAGGTVKADTPKEKPKAGQPAPAPTDESPPESSAKPAKPMQ